MNKYQAFAELMKDETKANEIIADTIEQTQQNLLKYDLEFTTEELKEIAAKVATMSETDELNEDALDDVAGGVAFASLCAAALCFYAAASAAKVIKKWYFK